MVVRSLQVLISYSETQSKARKWNLPHVNLGRMQRRGCMRGSINFTWRHLTGCTLLIPPTAGFFRREKAVGDL